MESIIEEKIFGIDKTIALAKALGYNPGQILADVLPEYLNNTVLESKKKKVDKYGKWYEEIIDLKTYIQLIDMYAGSPEMQKKAYTALRVHLRKCEFLDYEAIVHDSAFGAMPIQIGDD